MLPLHGADEAPCTAFGARFQGAALDTPWGSRARHQLILALSGVVHLHVPDGQWLLPAGWAAWVSADVRHRLRSGPFQLWAAYLSPFITPMPRRDTCVLPAPPLAVELVLAAAQWGPGRGVDDEVAESVLGAIAHLSPRWMEDARPLHLPQAQSPELERAMAAVTERGEDAGGAAAAAGMSPRTLSRRFHHETRGTLRAFTRTARALRAAELLCAPGARVADVARATRFASPEALARAFTAVVGEGPVAFRRRAHRAMDRARDTHALDAAAAAGARPKRQRGSP